jgi:two-component system, LytTR family, sensor kinase
LERSAERRLGLRLACVAWGVYAAVAVVQTYAALWASEGARALSWGPAVMVLFRLALLAALTAPLARLAHRFRIRGPRRAAHLLLHVAVMTLVVVAYAAVIVLSRWLVTGGPGPGLWIVAVNRSDDVALYYAVLLTISYATDFHAQLQDRRVAASELAAELARSQLGALEAQLQPHFLFNALNTVSALVRDDPEGADRMITRIGALLRRSLDWRGVQEVPLRDELETLGLYLEIQHVRYASWLRTEIRVAAETADVLVPTFILQPLVENAIRHGIAPLERAGRLRISASLRGERLALEVRDDGVGLPARGAWAEGVGVGNVRRRLERLYGGAQSFELIGVAPHGTAARVLLPARR